MSSVDSKTLVDTSVWIEFFNNQSSSWALDLDQLIEKDEVVISPLIKCEILAGIGSDREFRKVSSFLSGFEALDDSTESVLSFAVQIYRGCRKKGITVRTLVDCIIASVAIGAGIPVLARDRDFEHIQRVFTLELVSPD